MTICEINDGWILQNEAKRLGFLEKADGWTRRQAEQAIQVINGAVESAYKQGYEDGEEDGERSGYDEGYEAAESLSD